MKFNLHVIRNLKELVWEYDTSDNSFRDENGKLLLEEYEKHSWLVSPAYTRWHNPNKKSTKNNLLEISLGTKCNFNCKYCSQTAFRDKSYSGTPRDVPAFIEMLKKSGLQCSRIQLWGGEPLVYWKTIQALVPELRKLYPDAHISAPSNGSLLTREKVDFFHKYGMYLYISHDGCGNEKRENDILDNPVVLDAIRYAQEIMPADKVAFGATPSAGNTDGVKILKFFKNKVSSSTKASVHNIVRCHNSGEPVGVEYSKLSKEQLQEYSDSVFSILNSIEDTGDYSLHRKQDQLINCIIHKAPLESVRAECAMPFSDGLIVDLKGRVLQCHNHPIQDQSFGTLDELDKVTALGYAHWSSKQRCCECLVIHGCKGGCPSADDKANELACPNLYALHYGIFKATVGALFGVYLKEVTVKK